MINVDIYSNIGLFIKSFLVQNKDAKLSIKYISNGNYVIKILLGKGNKPLVRY